MEDEEVTPKLASNSSGMWALDGQAVHAALTTAWDEALRSGRVEGALDIAPPVESDTSTSDPNAGEPAVVFPRLGRVTAMTRVFEDSLVTHADDGRSHGFFLMVRGRLVNPDDEKLLLHDPQFGAFNRSQFIVHADGLDAELLADRESLRRDTPMTRELAVLQVALYRVARNAVEDQAAREEEAARPESRLPVRSRELFRDPMAALFARAETRPTSIDLDNPVIDRRALGVTAAVARLEEETGHLQVNSAHPFYQVVEEQAGGGKKGAAVMRAFELFAVAERLTEGFLHGRGLPEEQVNDIMDWRDKLLRSLALGYGENPDDAILELRTASHAGDKRFENAIAFVFELMGFHATRDGGVWRERYRRRCSRGSGPPHVHCGSKGGVRDPFGTFQLRLHPRRATVIELTERRTRL